MEQYVIANIEGTEFENATLKNRWIAQTQEPVLIFANRDVTTGEELVQMLEQYSYMDEVDVLILCQNAPEQVDLKQILFDQEIDIYALILKRSVICDTGPFNDRLEAETNREFLCRAVEQCRLLFLECTEVAWEKSYTKESFRTNAYLLTRYLQPLKSGGLIEQALEQFSVFAEKCGYREYFEQTLADLLDENREKYEQIYLATAPILIIRGGNGCYGVLQNFADQLASALVRQGQRVIRIGGNENCDEEQIAALEKELYRAVIGFQATILLKDMFRVIRGRRFEFWFDHPMFFHSLFDHVPEPVTFLCQDGGHADYINRMCEPNRGIHFPPGIEPVELCSVEKQFDISFVGTYFDDEEMWDIIHQKEGILGEAARKTAEYLLTHVNASFHEAADVLLTQYPQLLEQYSYPVVIENLFEACRIAPYTYRRRVIRKILDAGYELHVYGDSWKKYPKQPGDHLVIHDEVAPAELPMVLGQSKISLNVMTWHKDGMTERIMEIMMAGTVCLTDESIYLKKHFTHLKDIALYRLDQLDELPRLIKTLLDHQELRETIVQHAYRKVREEYTWDTRAEQLLKIISGML